jgi:aryl-alcohol dehydrogenase-like predicted oxidoreductase
VIEALRRIADAHDATPAQVALAWLIAKPNVVAIPGASSVDQLRHNVAAADLDLDADELDELTAASDAFTPVGVPTAGMAMLRARRGGT